MKGQLAVRDSHHYNIQTHLVLQRSIQLLDEWNLRVTAHWCQDWKFIFIINSTRSLSHFLLVREAELKQACLA